MSKLPIELSVNDQLRDGFQTYGLGHAPQDPVEAMLRRADHVNELTKLHALGAVHGAHAPTLLFRERDLASHCRRLPGTGLPSSLLSLELLMGTEDRVQFGQFYHLPNPVSDLDRLSVHERIDTVATSRQ